MLCNIVGKKVAKCFACYLFGVHGRL